MRAAAALAAALAPAAAHLGTDLDSVDADQLKQIGLQHLSYARTEAARCAPEVPQCATAEGWQAQVACVRENYEALTSEHCRHAALQILNSANDVADAEEQERLGWYPGKSWVPKHGYIGGDDASCVAPACRGCNSTTDNLPYVWSYHVHLLWQMIDNDFNKTARRTSDDFRDAFVKEFNVKTAKKCKMGSFLFDLWNQKEDAGGQADPANHLFADICEMPGPLPGGDGRGMTVFSQGGPFLLYHNRGFIISPLDFHRVVPWLVANRPRNDLLKIFIHPNTGCQFNDLRHWSMWAGPSGILNMRVMKGCVWAGCGNGGQGLGMESCIFAKLGRVPDGNPRGYGKCYDTPTPGPVDCQITVGDSNVTTEACTPPSRD